ncbi:MAG: radical SAM protein, partial [Deltaproteobacteria bacterium]|nr:radical SAM protein [Deltaproteobacteria bacterium]
KTDKIDYNKAVGTLKDMGLSWLSKPPHSPAILIHYIERGHKAELPFVPEFAHDLTRAQKLIEGEFYDIMPISVEFVPTLNCTCRCQQCSYKMQKISCGVWPLNNISDPRWHMKMDIVKPLVQRIADAGIRYMVVTGGGEPLMNSRVTLEALKEAISHGIETGLYTNGTCLNRRRANQILDLEPKFVRISVNAGSEEVHTKYHMPIGKKPLFKNVQEGVKHLALHKAVAGKSTEIGLSYIVNPINYKDCGKFAQWVGNVVSDVAEKAQNDAPSIDFVRFAPTVDYFSHMQHSQEFFDEAVDLIEGEAIPVLNKVNVSTTLFIHRFQHIGEKKEYGECLGCPWFAEVSPDGSLYVCCEMNFFPAYRIGDLLSNSLQTVWLSEKRRHVLSRLKLSRLRGCPVFCKPHKINKIANKIREGCKVASKKDHIGQWLKDLNNLHNWRGDEFFKKPKTVAF